MQEFATKIIVYKDEEKQDRCTFTGYYSNSEDEKTGVAAGAVFTGGIYYVIDPDTEKVFLVGSELLKEIGLMTLDLAGK